MYLQNGYDMLFQNEIRKEIKMNRKIYEYRGFMLDVCRHFMPVNEIKTLLLAAAELKLNRMHWHLTDDQGCKKG